MNNYYLNSIKYGLGFYFPGVTIYKVHSPYLYNFIQDIYGKKKHYCFPAIEHLRKQLLTNNNELEMIDFGAGSRLNNANKRKIKEVAHTSLSPKSQCEALFWMVNRMQPDTILELGSSLGISTLYLAMANSKTEVISFEGNPDSLSIAKQQSALLKIKNITFVEGDFKKTFGVVLDSMEKVDMVFIDGNHQYQATVDYFYQLLPKVHSKTILIFDDIYWSPGMKKAWEEIKSHNIITASLDLYTYGIVFFDPQFIEKKHVKLLPLKYKPWQKANL